MDRRAGVANAKLEGRGRWSRKEVDGQGGRGKLEREEWRESGGKRQTPRVGGVEGEVGEQ